jgi:hypothetical protein
VNCIASKPHETQTEMEGHVAVPPPVIIQRWIPGPPAIGVSETLLPIIIFRCHSCEVWL